jgi:16S rRNA (cytosine967-C5)-methyltransferase
VDPLAPVADPRTKALEILRAVENGAFADALIEEARPALSPRDRAFLLELVYGTLRNRSRLDWALDHLSSQPVSSTDPWTRNLLRLGAYQILFLDRVPVSAAVNTSVELAKQRGRKTGYVNGLLRNLDRRREGVPWPGPEDPVKRLSVLYSHPDWLLRRWISRYGLETTEEALRQNNLRAPLVIRTNSLKTTRSALTALLIEQGAEVRETRYAPSALEILSSPGLSALPAFQVGLFMVQDEAAQLIALMLGAAPDDAVLDACAAPGGKATHLAEIMENRGRITALDIDAGRLNRIRENSRRLGAAIIEPVKADASKYEQGRYDRVLIDAPCSGLGVLRRHPDGRWNKTESDILGRCRTQAAILENCAGLLKPGGSLVYATCTTEPEENEQIIESFLSASDRTFVLDDPRPLLPQAAHHLVDSRGFLRTFPAAPDMDGFFGARLIRAG